jgi:hypothetical protein
MSECGDMGGRIVFEFLFIQRFSEAHWAKYTLAMHLLQALSVLMRTLIDGNCNVAFEKAEYLV